MSAVLAPADDPRLRSLDLPPFLAPGGPLRLRVLHRGGERRWWCTRGALRALDPFLRNALGRRWPLSSALARVLWPAQRARWRPEVADWLRAIGHGPAADVVVQLGSRGRYRKWVCMGLDEARRPAWVLKASCSRDSRGSVMAEAAALRALALRMPAGVEVPRLFGETVIDGAVLTLQQACRRPRSGRIDPWSERHQRFCGALFADAAPAPDAWHDALARREEVRARLATYGADARAVADACGRLGAFARRAFAPRPPRLGWVHRDFTPWNTLARGGTLTVVDWEWAEPLWIPLHDALHFHLFPAIHGGDEDPALWCRLAADGSPLRGLGAEFGLHDLAPYAALYLYDTLLFYGDAIAADPAQTFADPLLGRLRRLADGWVAGWSDAQRREGVA